MPYIIKEKNKSRFFTNHNIVMTSFSNMQNDSKTFYSLETAQDMLDMLTSEGHENLEIIEL